MRIFDAQEVRPVETFVLFHEDDTLEDMIGVLIKLERRFTADSETGEIVVCSTSGINRGTLHVGQRQVMNARTGAVSYGGLHSHYSIIGDVTLPLDK